MRDNIKFLLVIAGLILGGADVYADSDTDLTADYQPVLIMTTPGGTLKRITGPRQPTLAACEAATSMFTAKERARYLAVAPDGTRTHVYCMPFEDDGVAFLSPIPTTD